MCKTELLGGEQESLLSASSSLTSIPNFSSSNLIISRLGSALSQAIDKIERNLPGGSTFVVSVSLIPALFALGPSILIFSIRYTNPHLTMIIIGDSPFQSGLRKSAPKRFNSITPGSYSIPRRSRIASTFVFPFPNHFVQNIRHAPVFQQKKLPGKAFQSAGTGPDHTGVVFWRIVCKCTVAHQSWLRTWQL